MDQHLRLLPTDGTLLPDPTSYRRLVGRLIYLTVTQPDINYVVNVLSQFMHSPRSAHMDAAYRLVRYLKGSLGKGIFLSSSSSLDLRGYCDSDWDFLSSAVPKLVVLQLDIAFFLALTSSLRKLRSKIPFLVPLLKPSIEPWPLQLRNYNG